jgi:hypothetical protein
MPENSSLEASREQLLRDGERRPGVAEAMRLFGLALPATEVAGRAEAARLTVATAANGQQR